MITNILYRQARFVKDVLSLACYKNYYKLEKERQPRNVDQLATITLLKIKLYLTAEFGDPSHYSDHNGFSRSNHDSIFTVNRLVRFNSKIHQILKDSMKDNYKLPDPEIDQISSYARNIIYTQRPTEVCLELAELCKLKPEPNFSEIFLNSEDQISKSAKHMETLSKENITDLLLGNQFPCPKLYNYLEHFRSFYRLSYQLKMIPSETINLLIKKSESIMNSNENPFVKDEEKIKEQKEFLKVYLSVIYSRAMIRY